MACGDEIQPWLPKLIMQHTSQQSLASHFIASVTRCKTAKAVVKPFVITYTSRKSTVAQQGGRETVIHFALILPVGRLAVAATIIYY